MRLKGKVQLATVRLLLGNAALSLVFSTLAFLLAYLQPFGLSRDYSQYDWFFSWVRAYGFDSVGMRQFEVGFVALTYLLTRLFRDNLLVFGAMSFFSVTAKFLCVRVFSKTSFTAVLVMAFYFSRYLPLHELTQVRASLAIALLLVAFLFRSRDQIVPAGIFSAGAALLHYSSILAIPFVLLRPTRRRQVLTVAVAEFLLVFTTLGIAIAFFSDSFPVLAIYRQIGFGANPNPLPLPLILDLIMIGVGLAMWHELTVPMRHVLALQVFGIAFFYGSLGFAILAHRVREMFSVFWVVFLAQSPKTSPVVRWATMAFGVLCAIAYTYVYWLNPEEVFFS